MSRTIVTALTIVSMWCAAAAWSQQAQPESAAAGPPPMPTNGMSMTEVQDLFGGPLAQQPAVGQPPITRWRYDDYIVYFEHDRVITSVADIEVGLAAGQ